MRTYYCKVKHKISADKNKQHSKQTYQDRFSRSLFKLRKTKPQVKKNFAFITGLTYYRLYNLS